MEDLKLVYDDLLKSEPNNIQAIQYLGMWHLERQSFQKVYMSKLVALGEVTHQVYFCLAICYAMEGNLQDCSDAIDRAGSLVPLKEEDLRVMFCRGLYFEKKKDFPDAFAFYAKCLNRCSDSITRDGSIVKDAVFQDLESETLLRMAMIKKEIGAWDDSWEICNRIFSTSSNSTLKANALCIKGLLSEMKGNFAQAEVDYRTAVQLEAAHLVALERLGRVYLRFRETIPAAVQCFFKSVETNEYNYMVWYLLGRCYMATCQYDDACEAYNRAVNLNPNDALVWCSLGNLYYHILQFREALGMFARALTLDSTLSEAWYNVGVLYEMVGQISDAQHAFDRAHEHGIRAPQISTSLPPCVPRPSVSPGDCSPTSLAITPVRSSTSSSSYHPTSSMVSSNSVEDNSPPLDSGLQTPFVDDGEPCVTSQRSCDNSSNSESAYGRVDTSSSSGGNYGGVDTSSSSGGNYGGVGTNSSSGRGYGGVDTTSSTSGSGYEGVGTITSGGNDYGDVCTSISGIGYGGVGSSRSSSSSSNNVFSHQYIKDDHQELFSPPLTRVEETSTMSTHSFHRAVTDLAEVVGTVGRENGDNDLEKSSHV